MPVHLACPGAVTTPPITRILIVDDHAIFCEALAVLLEKHAGFRIACQAADGPSALAVLREAVASGVNHIDTSDCYGPHVTNGLIREYLPKGIEITSHQPYLDAIANELNDRPRATLGFLTPREVFTKLLTEDVASTG